MAKASNIGTAADGAGNRPFFLRMLGALTLADANGRPVKLRTRKALLLLACLATEPRQVWPRERLAAFLWGDRQEEQARNSLRTALSDVRGVLGDDALVVEGGNIALAGGRLESDLARLRALATGDGEAGALAEFYGGDFLADAGDAIDAPDWLAAIRGEARDLAIDLLERGIGRQLAVGAHDAAMRNSRELLSLDPLREASHRRLMRLHADLGERSRAIAQYQSCTQLLRSELGISPSAETRALADEIAVSGDAALSTLKLIAAAPVAEPAGAAGRGQPQAGEVSIAVLPFVNLSGDAGQDYFADGISEDITIDLARIDGLSVAASGSTRLYRATTLPPSRIASELGVDYILAGAVRRSDTALRITASLVDGRSNRQVWGERYDRELVRIFDIQAEIAASVAGAVRNWMAPAAAKAASTARGTASVAAHEHYLRGRAFLREMLRRSVELSKVSFEQAITADPDYALAHAGLAEAITMLGWHYEAARPLLDAARAHCDTALRLDPDLAEAHCSLGRYHSFFLRFEEAEAAFDRAIAISPGLAEAYLYRGLMRLTVGRAGDAIDPLRSAFARNRQDLHTGMMLMNCQGALGLGEERAGTAREVWSLAQRRIASNPYDDQAAYVGAFALEVLGRNAEALQWANVAAAFEVDDARATYNVACLFAVLGETEKALALLRRALEQGVAAVKRDWIRDHDPDWRRIRGTRAFEAVFAEG